MSPRAASEARSHRWPCTSKGTSPSRAGTGWGGVWQIAARVTGHSPPIRSRAGARPRRYTLRRRGARSPGIAPLRPSRAGRPGVARPALEDVAEQRIVGVTFSGCRHDSGERAGRHPVDAVVLPAQRITGRRESDIASRAAECAGTGSSVAPTAPRPARLEDHRVNSDIAPQPPERGRSALPGRSPRPGVARYRTARFGHCGRAEGAGGTALGGCRHCLAGEHYSRALSGDLAADFAGYERSGPLALAGHYRPIRERDRAETEADGRHRDCRTQLSASHRLGVRRAFRTAVSAWVGVGRGQRRPARQRAESV